MLGDLVGKFDRLGINQEANGIQPGPLGAPLDRQNSGEAFYDSLTKQWVAVDNFSFPATDNHFSQVPVVPENGQNSPTQEASGHSSLLDSELLSAEQFQVAPGDEVEFERLFRLEAIEAEEPEIGPHQPRLLDQSKDQEERPRTLRRLSDELGSEVLMPTKSGPSTPRVEPNPCHETKNATNDLTNVPNINAKPLFQKKSQPKSAIPRYVRNAAARAKSYSPSPVQRKVQKSLVNSPDNSQLDRDKSQSVSNLAPIRMAVNRSNSKSENNLVGLGTRPKIHHKKPEFGHVKSQSERVH